MPRRRSIWALFASITLFSAVLVSSTSSQAAVQPAKPSDFNGDGYPDLAIGAWLARPKPFTLRRHAGGVGLVYGGKSVLGTKTQLLHRGLSWVPGPQAPNRFFGTEVAAADFNGDGYSDIAICSGVDNGRLTMGFGGSTGLWRGFDPPSSTTDKCGSMVAGDFNGDGFGDLVMAQGLRVFYGQAWLTDPSKVVFKPLDGTAGRGEPAVGDVTGDGIDDLVTGASGPTPIRLYKGGPNGLPATADQTVPADSFNYTALGDVDNDGFADLVAGKISATRAGQTMAGMVRLWWGSATGIDTGRPTVDLAQDVPGVPGDPRMNDYFGIEVALGDVDGDQHADLAVASRENVNNLSQAGTVTVIRGAKAGWNLSNPSYLSQESPGIPEESEIGDQFGNHLLFRDFDRDGRAELVVGTPADDVGSRPIVRKDAGTVTVFRGSSTGVSTTGVKLITPTTVRMMSTEAQLGELDGTGY